MPIPNTGVPIMELVKEFSDFERERVHWLDLTEFEIIKVCRYMLEFGREEFLLAHGGFLRQHLQGMINDCVEQIKYDGDPNERWCV